MYKLSVAVFAVALALVLAEPPPSSERPYIEPPKGKREAPVRHYGPPPPLPKPQALMMFTPALSYGPPMLNLGSSLGSGMHLTGRSMHGPGSRLSSGRGSHSLGGLSLGGGHGSFGSFKGGIRGGSLSGGGGHSFGGFGGHSSLSGLSLGGGHGLSGASFGKGFSSGGPSHGGFGRGSFGGHGLSLGGGHSFGGSLKGLGGGASYSSGGHSFGGLGQSFGGLKGGSLGGSSLSSGHNFVSSSLGGSLKGLGGLSLGGGHSFGGNGGNSFSSGHGFGGSLKGGSLGGLSLGGGSLGGYSLGSGSLGHGQGGLSLGGSLGHGQGGISLGHNLGGSGYSNIQNPVALQYATGQGLSNSYDSRTLGLGQGTSGSGGSGGYSGGSLGHGQSFNLGDLKGIDFGSADSGLNLGELKGTTSFDTQSLGGHSFSGQSGQSLGHNVGRFGLQKLHTSVSFGGLDSHSQQPQQSYGAPSGSGGQDHVSYNIGQPQITTLAIQSGGDNKNGPVTFSQGSPMPNTLTNTYVTVANNPSNSYGVPMYAQSSYSGGQSSYEAPSQSYGQPEVSYQQTSQPESSYGVPETTYQGSSDQGSYGETSSNYLPPSYEEPSSSYGTPSFTSSSSSGSYSGSSGGYQGKIPFKPSAFLGATSVSSHQESYGGGQDGGSSYESTGSSYESPNYNTISYSMPSTAQTQYGSQH